MEEERMDEETTGSLQYFSSRSKQSRGSCSSDTFSTVYNSKSLRKLVIRKETINDENFFSMVSASAAVGRSDHGISGIGDSANNGSIDAKQRTRARGCQLFQTSDEDVEHGSTLSDVVTDAQPNLDCTEQTPGPTRVQTQPRSESRKYQGGVQGRHTLNEVGDWLNLSLKFPTQPAVNVLGVFGDELRLSLDINIPVAPSAIEDSKEFQPREGKDVTTSGTPPVVIISSAEDVVCGNQPGDLMGITSGNLPIYYPPWVRTSDSIDQWLPARKRGTTLHESLTKVSPESPVVDITGKLEISDPSFDHFTKPQDESGQFSSYQQINELDNVGINDGSRQRLSLIQTVGHCSGIVARCLASRKPMRHAEGDSTIIGILDSQSSQLHSVGKRDALLDKFKAPFLDSSLFLTAMQDALKGQNEPSNPVASVAKIQLPCQSITLDLNNKPDTFRYCLPSCPSHVFPEFVSTLPYSLQEQSKLPLNTETPFIKMAASSNAPEYGICNLAPVLPCEESAASLAKVVMEEQCEHCQMEVAVPLQRMDGSGDLKITKSKIGGVVPSRSTSSHSSPQNSRAYFVDRKHFGGGECLMSAQVLKKSRTQGHIENLFCKGLYLNDVACCSSRLPPRESSREACISAKVDKVGYAHSKIVNQLCVVESSDMEGARRIPMNDYEFSRMDAVNFANEGMGEAKYQRSSAETENCIHRTHDILEELEHAVSTKSKQCRELFVRSRGWQRYSSFSLVRCPLSNASVEPHANCKRKLAMSAVDKIASENNNNHIEEVGKCTVTSLTSLTEPEFSEMWKTGPRCDLCNTGPSLSLGEWYAWCCGLPVSSCWCPEQKKMKKQMAIGFQKTQKVKLQGQKVPRQQWSGKVHKMCALWSSEVFQEICPRKGIYLKLLDVAVKRGKNLLCKDPQCKKNGATLGCRVKNCRRSFHYPCAERLASRCLLRMWDCLTIPIACMSHRFVEFETKQAKEKFFPHEIINNYRLFLSNQKNYLGNHLISTDISQGEEAIQIPCTNDVDDDPMPKIKYITKCWCKGVSVDHLYPDGTELAKGCNGCGGPNFDCWTSPMSVHILGTDGTRESDKRLDWQSEYMHGRLPYNAYGLLQLGPESKDVVECNSRCTCGVKCKNRELQRGLKVPLELFKTTDRGWGVRSLQQIPRGRFVVEYVGEVLTQAEADEQAEKYDENQLSYLFNLDHPGVGHEDSIVLDGIYMSNIARFINHSKDLGNSYSTDLEVGGLPLSLAINSSNQLESCEGNLMIYRVYSETTVCRYFRIGMYAIQDIEIGDELSYDYNYAVSKELTGLPVDDPTAIRCCCGAQSCRKWLWLGGNDSQLKHLTVPWSALV